MQRLLLQFSCQLKIWVAFGVLFHTVNVIILFGVYKPVDIESDTYARAVGETHTKAARWDGLGFLLCGDGYIKYSG